MRDAAPREPGDAPASSCSAYCGIDAACFEPNCKLVMLASGVPTAYRVAVDDAGVYLLADFNGAVLKVPKLGGEPTTLVRGGGRPTDIAVRDDLVYWTTTGGDDWSGSLSSAPVGGGPMATIASGLNSPVSIAVGDDGIYVGNSGNGSIMLVPKGGYPAGATVRALTSVPETPGTLAALAIDATNVYWTSPDGPTYIRSGSGAVYKAPRTGGPPTMLATRQDDAREMALDATGVYWANRNAVMKVPLNGGAPIALASKHATSLASDGHHLYFLTFDDSDQKTFRVIRMSTDGQETTLLASGLGFPAGLALDDEALYWCVGKVASNSPMCASTCGNALILKLLK